MTGETILITRPKGDEAALTDALHERGFRVIHEPLTEIFLLHTERQALHNALLAEPDAVLVTSRHAVNALALLSDLRDACLVCVGEATADAAESLGFTRVFHAGGNVQKLVEYIYAGYDTGTRFLYPSGNDVRVELDAVLAEQGMEVERLILYDAIPSPQLSDTLVELLKRGQVDAATFMSPRAAQIFVALLAQAGIRETVSSLRAVALSAAVAEPLAALPWRGIHIADEATLASLVECADNLFHV